VYIKSDENTVCGELKKMPKLEFIFDFASPNAYLSLKIIPDILTRSGASLQVSPVLLGGLFKLTNNRAPMIAFDEVKGKLEYEMLETQRFISRHNLSDFRFNPYFPINSITLMRGLVAAQQLGFEQVYLESVLSAMWEHELKMDDPEIAISTWNNAGLDGEKIMHMSQKDEIKNILKKNTDAAVNRGVFGVPTFFVKSEIFFGKERLGQVEEALKA
tara:strand:- start:23 stop:670 length:648 start_codon:yes stop_codon:yes gene_type:complete